MIILAMNFLTMKKITMNLSSYECGCYEKIQVMKISSYEMNVSHIHKPVGHKSDNRSNAR